MSVTDQVFIAPGRPADAVLARLRSALDDAAVGRASDTGLSYFAFGEVEVYVHRSHEFPDDEDAALSRYPYLVEVRHLGGDVGEQEKVAHRVFEAARGEGWPALRFHDMQVIVEAYDPPERARAS